MQVTRQRRTTPPRSRAILGSRRFRLVAATTAAIAVAGSGVAYGSSTVFGDHQVGTEYATGLQVSADQQVKPIGERLVTEDGKFMSSTVSPDGRFLAVGSTDRSVALQVFDLSTYQRVWRVGTAAGVDQRWTDLSVGQEGPTYSPDGRFLWLSQKDGLTRFPVNPDGTLGVPSRVPLPVVDGRSALPGQATFSADGATLYVAANGQDSVLALDPATGAVQQRWPVGIAPRQLALVGSKLYVSNEGGRRAKDGEETMDSYGSAVPADGHRGTSTTGTLSVIDTSAAAAPVGSIAVGLHPTALHASGGALFVTNTNDDTVSVVSTRTDQVEQTVNTQPWSASRVGYQPTGVTLTDDGHLLVTLARANAVAVYRYHGSPKAPVDFVGLLPTDYYPAEVAEVGGKVLVTNTRGIDARGPLLTFNKGLGTTPATGHGTHGTTGSLTRFALPSDRDIGAQTPTVFAQNGWGDSDTDVKTAKGDKASAVPVPKRIGDPSTIKYVFMIVKENRTYDQVYGDMPEGNGDPALAQFGEEVTPNQHALARQFGLYDNTYDIGTNSAEGHNWIMQGDDPEYTESTAGEYVRSYDTEEDVLGHQRSGFLWSSIQDAGRSARNFGEFLYTEGKPAGSWQQYYCATRDVEAGGDPAQLTTPDLRGNYGSVIPSLNKITVPEAPPYDLTIPDVYRAEIWKRHFQQNGPASFNMMWFSSDHTGGPTSPRSAVADGDLAVGKVVDAISHSKYWKESAIFVVEDDSQNGADHVDGHRAPIQVISPWARHGRVDSRFYSQITLVRTIQQILGAKPLNQRLAAATPMYGAFTSKPDLTPYDAVPNRIPLTEAIATPPACGLDTLGRTGAAAARVTARSARAATVPDAEQDLAGQWGRWKKQQRLTAAGARADSVAPEMMSRWTWYATHQWKVPYPGDSKVYAPSQVPGGAIPSAETD